MGSHEVSSDRGVVSSGHRQATAAGLWALELGGSAIDAAVAAAFVSFVAEPNNASVAGYGHLSAFMQETGRFVTVDHGPRAPAAARPDMFEIAPGEDPAGHDWPDVVGDRNAVGGLAVAAPGAVPGLYEAHGLGGRLPWAQLIEPAIELAERGLEVDWALLLLIASRYEEIRSRPALADILLKDGRLPRARSADGDGDRLSQGDLARTLRAIAADGPAGLHEGPVAESVVAEVSAQGGVLGPEDLGGYTAKVLFEQPAAYRDLQYVTANDQVGYEMLNILAQFDIGALDASGAEHFHLIAEAAGHAFADNVTYSGDPDHCASPLAGLASPAFAAERARGIAGDRAASRPISAADPWPFDDGDGDAGPPPSVGGARGTTQVTAADSEGNMVALITTIGDDFGALVVAPNTGVFLNNSMMNYDPRPGRSNSIAPGKMPFFAVPAIVAAREGRACLAVAGSGGYPILAGVVNTLVNHVDHGMPIQAAIDHPRVHSQANETYIDARVDPGVREQLERMGHTLVVQEVTPGELPFSRVSAVTRGEAQMHAGSAPAWSTEAGAA